MSSSAVMFRNPVNINEDIVNRILEEESHVKPRVDFPVESGEGASVRRVDAVGQEFCGGFISSQGMKCPVHRLKVC